MNIRNAVVCFLVSFLCVGSGTHAASVSGNTYVESSPADTFVEMDPGQAYEKRTCIYHGVHHPCILFKKNEKRYVLFVKFEEQDGNYATYTVFSEWIQNPVNETLTPVWPIQKSPGQ